MTDGRFPLQLRKDVDPTELVQKVDGALLRSVPVSTLARANITSLDQVENKIWRLSQVTFHVCRHSSNHPKLSRSQVL